MGASRGLVVAVRGLILAVACSACRLGFDRVGDTEDAVLPDVPAGWFTIGGTVTGLGGIGLVLQNNGADDLPIAQDGAFRFATATLAGAVYAVTISAVPAGQGCVISNASGVIADASIADVEVTCFPLGSCPPSPITFLSSGAFSVPDGCTTITVEARGGGGAGGGKNAGDVAAPGGAGGRAVATFTGLVPGTAFAITIGQGGTCGSRTDTAGAFAGGGGGIAGGSGDGRPGAGMPSPAGGGGGAGSTGVQPGGAGGAGGHGGGGGGGGGDSVSGNSGGGATAFRQTTPVTDHVVAGGGGGAGAADQNGDVAGRGGAACVGYGGADGAPAAAGTRSGGGGGGGACMCLGGACDEAPTPAGGAGGVAGTSGDCAAAQDGAAGRLVISFP